jgi:PAS domain S-box-containing protein
MSNSSAEGGSPPDPTVSEAVLERFAPHPYQSLDEDGTILTVNDAWEEVLGYDAEEVTGTWFGALLTEDSRSDFEAAVDQLTESGDVSDLEVQLTNATGRVLTILLDGKAEYEDGAFVRTHWQFHDITEQLRRKAELERKSRAMDAAPIGITISDANREDNPLIYANRSFTELTGYESENIVGENCRFLQGEKTEEAQVAKLAEAIEAERPVTVDLRNYRKDGTEFWNRVTVAPVFDEQDELINYVGFQQDVTQEKDREQQLERYERIVENLPIGVYQNTAGPVGSFRFLNEAMVDIFEADSKGDLLEKDVSDLYADEPDRGEFSDRLESDGKIEDYELKLETLTGKSLWGAITAITRDVDGETVFDGAIQDITERKEYEQQLEEQLDNLDILNQVLRHDIRNDLQVVTVYIDVLAEEVGDQYEEEIERLHESARHAVELTRTARDVADIMLTEPTDRTPINLQWALEDEIDSIRSAYPEALITTDGPIPDVSVLGNDMLDSVFRNVLKNAIQHNDSDVPEVTISTAVSEETVQVRIADNGPGVPDDQKEEIFGKGEKGLESAGTGIGLYLVDTLIDAFGGDVWVEDDEPTGAVFSIDLPLAE